MSGTISRRIGIENSRCERIKAERRRVRQARSKTPWMTATIHPMAPLMISAKVEKSMAMSPAAVSVEMHEAGEGE